MQAPLKQHARRLGQLLALLSCVYLGWLAWTALSAPGSEGPQWPGWWRGIGAVLASTAAMMAVAVGWYLLARALSPGISLHRALTASALSQPAKYLPGNVLHFASRHWILHAEGHRHADLVAATLLESASLVAVALAFGSFLLRLPADAWFDSGLSLILVAALVWTATLAWVLWRSGGRRSRIIMAMLLHSACAAGYFLASTLALSLLAGDHLVPFPQTQALAAVALSWVGGYVVIGAPGGIGVREALLVAFLNAADTDVSLLGAILGLRLSMIAADLLLFALASLVGADKAELPDATARDP